jgi:hypothetical protein
VKLETTLNVPLAGVASFGRIRLFAISNWGPQQNFGSACAVAAPAAAFVLMLCLKETGASFALVSGTLRYADGPALPVERNPEPDVKR